VDAAETQVLGWLDTRKVPKISQITVVAVVCDDLSRTLYFLNSGQLSVTSI
jgi:hypothetical protein